MAASTQSPTLPSVVSALVPWPTVGAETPRRLSTVSLVKASAALAAAATLLSWFVASAIFVDMKHGAQTIGKDTVPSIVAAQEIRAGLATMKGALANAALTRGESQQKAWRDYDQSRSLLADKLVDAAQNITFGDEERRPIVAIAKNIQLYAHYAGQAREAIALAPGQTVSEPAEIALRNAAAVMSDELIPAADDLNYANERILASTWTQRKSAVGTEILLLLAVGVPSAAMLVFLQLALFRRTRRMFNPALVAATLLAVSGPLYFASIAKIAASELANAKENAFDSVNALAKGRAIAYGANADESLFLVDPGMAKYYEASFRAAMTSLVGVNIDQSDVAKTMSAELDGVQAKNCPAAAIRFSGQIGDELRNVTFKGECEAAVKLFKMLSLYETIDTRIRAFEAQGQHDAAIALDLGVNPNESNWAFDQLDRALRSVIKINQDAFDTSIARVFRLLSPLEGIVTVGCLLIVVLTYFGVRPRLSEYRD